MSHKDPARKSGWKAMHFYGHHWKLGWQFGGVETLQSDGLSYYEAASLPFEKRRLKALKKETYILSSQISPGFVVVSLKSLMFLVGRSRTCNTRIDFDHSVRLTASHFWGTGWCRQRCDAEQKPCSQGGPGLKGSQGDGCVKWWILRQESWRSVTFLKIREN